MKKIIFILVAVTIIIYAEPIILSYERSPSQVASGLTYDLLDTRAPITRSYSGVFALKDKSEIAVNHTMIMHGLFEGFEDIAIDYVMLGLKNNFVPVTGLYDRLDFLGASRQYNTKRSRGKF